MINLNECKFGDRLVTKGGQMVVYLGHAKPSDMVSLETKEYHAIAGRIGEWFYFSKYTDKGTIIEHNGKSGGAGDPLNIAGLYNGNGLDLSQFTFGDRLMTICGVPAIFLGYNEAKGYYEIIVQSDITDKPETLFYEKDGQVNHKGLYRYNIIGKFDCNE